MEHISVLREEVLRALDPKPNEDFIDCTVNGGGHAKAILEKTAPLGRLLGIDWNQRVIENCKLKIDNFTERTVLICDNFAHLEKIAKKEGFGSVDGILFDLGISSWHLERSGKGFSFLRDEPLDMRYGAEYQISNLKTQNFLTAEKIINKWSEKEIEKNLREYGQEKFSKTIARKIVQAREIKPIATTFQLVDIIKQAIPTRYQHQRIHFATRTFQAIRIAVNDELNNLKTALPQAVNILKTQGRLVVISFHSLEDGIVKNFLRDSVKNGFLKPLNAKPMLASKAELMANKRARSAKLRAAIKI